MNDPDIIKLYFSRSEEALNQTRQKYGGYLFSVARRILRDERDAEEAVSDAVLAAWGSIPPNEPRDLCAYVGKLCRNASLDKLKHNKRRKRGGGEYEAVLDELSELSSGAPGPEQIAEGHELGAVINGFLSELAPDKRRMFVQRYWYLLSIREISGEADISEAAVKMQLSRMRAALKVTLRKEGFGIE